MARIGNLLHQANAQHHVCIAYSCRDNPLEGPFTPGGPDLSDLPNAPYQL